MALRVPSTDALTKIGLRPLDKSWPPHPKGEQEQEWKARIRQDVQEFLKTYSSNIPITPQMIEDSPELEEIARKIIEDFGLVWWGFETERPWLYQVKGGPPPIRFPSKSRTSSHNSSDVVYEHDLFYWNKDNRKLITESFYQYLVQRTKRDLETRSTRNVSDRSVSSHDVSLDSASSRTTRLLTGTRSEHEPNRECPFQGRDHQDAMVLERLGIWINKNGDMKDTIGAISHPSPHLLDRHPGTPTLSLLCAACQEPITLEVEKFDVSNTENLRDEKRTFKEKFAWTYSCNLNGRNVSALVKKLPERETRATGHKGSIWSFWTTSEGYSKQHFLRTAENNDNSSPEIEYVRPHVRSDRALTGRSSMASHVNAFGLRTPAIPMAERDSSPEAIPARLEHGVPSNRSRTNREPSRRSTSRSVHNLSRRPGPSMLTGTGDHGTVNSGSPRKGQLLNCENDSGTVSGPDCPLGPDVTRDVPTVTTSPSLQITVQEKAKGKRKRPYDDGQPESSASRPPTSFQPINGSGGYANTPSPAIASSLPQTTKALPEGAVRPSMEQSATRRSSFNNLYDVSEPGDSPMEDADVTKERPALPESSTTQRATRLERPLEAVAEGPRRPKVADTRISPTEAPTPEAFKGFKAWFQFDSPLGVEFPARRVVKLDTSLDVQQAFASIKKELGRRAQEKEVTRVWFKFEGSLLEVEGSETWEEVLDKVKSTSTTELDAFVDLE